MKSRKSARSIATWAVAILGFAFSGLALGIEWNLQPAGSKLAADIHWLHEAVMVLCTAIFVGVFGFMFWACYAHRKSDDMFRPQRENVPPLGVPRVQGAHSSIDLLRQRKI